MANPEQPLALGACSSGEQDACKRGLPIIRIGMPDTHYGRIFDEAIALGAPTLVSIGSLFRQGGGKSATGQGPGNFQAIGAAAWILGPALDSAGFTAMLAGGYRWTVDEYVDFIVTNRGEGAMPFPWAWWSSMDYCVEPEIAKDRSEVQRRMQLTVDTYGEILDLLNDWRSEGVTDVPDPLPILQGRTPADYVWSAKALADEIDTHHPCTCPSGDESCPAEWHREHLGLPALVGLGSVCRRELHGPEGLLAVLAALDAALPPHVKLHLFGVKGQAFDHLDPWAHRVASIDSMAWSYAARKRAKDAGVSKSTEFQAGIMRDWFTRQKQRAEALGGRLAVMDMVSAFLVFLDQRGDQRLVRLAGTPLGLQAIRELAAGPVRPVVELDRDLAWNDLPDGEAGTAARLVLFAAIHPETGLNFFRDRYEARVFEHGLVAKALGHDLGHDTWVSTAAEAVVQSTRDAIIRALQVSAAAAGRSQYGSWATVKDLLLGGLSAVYSWRGSNLDESLWSWSKDYEQRNAKAQAHAFGRAIWERVKPLFPNAGTTLSALEAAIKRLDLGDSYLDNLNEDDLPRLGEKLIEKYGQVGKTHEEETVERYGPVDPEPADAERAYFVSARKGKEHALLSGPYEDHRLAILAIPEITRKVEDAGLDPGGDAAIGTAKAPRGSNVRWPVGGVALVEGMVLYDQEGDAYTVREHGLLEDPNGERYTRQYIEGKVGPLTVVIDPRNYTAVWDYGKDYTEKSAKIELAKAQGESRRDDDGIEWRIFPKGIRYQIRGRRSEFDIRADAWKAAQGWVRDAAKEMDLMVRPWDDGPEPGTVVSGFYSDGELISPDERISLELQLIESGARGANLLVKNHGKPVVSWAIRSTEDALRALKDAQQRGHAAAPTTVTVEKHASRYTADLDDLLADYKARGMDERAAYNQLIKDRQLKPDIGLGSLVARWPGVVPRRLGGVEQVAFTPTHRDTVTDKLVQITPTAHGWSGVWETGMTGSEPGEPDHTRYVPLGEASAAPVDPHRRLLEVVRQGVAQRLRGNPLFEVISNDMASGARDRAILTLRRTVESVLVDVQAGSDSGLAHAADRELADATPMTRIVLDALFAEPQISSTLLPLAVGDRVRWKPEAAEASGYPTEIRSGAAGRVGTVKLATARRDGSMHYQVEFEGEGNERGWVLGLDGAALEMV